jgi:hypothetical protein
MAVAMAAAASISVRSNMSRVQFALILTVLGCVEPTATSPRQAGPTIVGQRQNNSYSIDAADRTVYVTLTQMRGEGEPVHSFIRRMFASADSAAARRLVIDLRSVGTGDARLSVPLIRGVVTRDRFVRRGGLVLIVGANSFSPAQNAATLLRQYANPVVVY